MNDRRERRLERLQDATGEKTKSGALDAAADYYLKMAGSPAHPTGAVEELLQLAIEQGNVTPVEIAETLHCEELAIEYHQSVQIG